MALGHTNSNTGTLFILKVVEKDEQKKKVEPYFSITKKVDGKWEKQKETVTRVSGNLKRIELEEKEWQGDKYHVVALYIEDGEETYLVDLRFNIPSRSLFNSLASLESYQNIAVSVYQNKSGYTSLGLWQDDKLAKWKYKMDELPEPAEVMFKGKKMHDYSKVDEFFLNVLKEISGKLGGSSKRAKAASQSEAAAAPAAGGNGPDEDVPF